MNKTGKSWANAIKEKINTCHIKWKYIWKLQGNGWFPRNIYVIKFDQG